MGFNSVFKGLMSTKCYFNFVLQITIVKHQVEFQPQITLIRASPLKYKKNVKEVVCMSKYTHFKIDIFQANNMAGYRLGDHRDISANNVVSYGMGEYSSITKIRSELFLPHQIRNREPPVSTCTGKSFSREVKRPKLQANRSPPSVASITVCVQFTYEYFRHTH